MKPAAWVVVPAIVTSLGWGLRGYIGGGPLGAMIPGVLLALILCQLLGFRAHAAATVAAFSALGIGFGGEMTYGQTLGLLRDNDTFWWGLTGTTLKGGVWGLLGGAILGLGFSAHRLTHWQLCFALLALLFGVSLGIHFVNVPKLIYFSDPVNRPRDESWAGFLLGAITLLACLRIAVPRCFAIPGWFSLAGLIGGAVGFGGGSLLIAAQFRLPQSWRWLPYWKFMEFSFGLLLGAAFGYCAFHLRQRIVLIEPPAEGADTSSRGRRFIASLLVGGLLLVIVFIGWPWTTGHLEQLLDAEPMTNPLQTAVRVLFGFTGLGCLLMIFSRRWPAVAWQVAISMTVVAAAIDWQRDLLTHGHIDLVPVYRGAFVVAIAACSVLFVAHWHTGNSPRLATLFVATTCTLMGIGYLMGLATTEIWAPAQAAVNASGSRAAYYWQTFRSLIVVHAIFTALFVLSLRAAVRIKPAADAK